MKASGKVTRRGPGCLLACRDARLGLAVAKAVEEQNLPYALITSSLGLEVPLLLTPDVAVFDAPLWLELARTGSRGAVSRVSGTPVILIGELPTDHGSERLPWPTLVLTDSPSPSDVVDAIYSLGKSETTDPSGVVDLGK